MCVVQAHAVVRAVVVVMQHCRRQPATVPAERAEPVRVVVMVVVRGAVRHRERVHPVVMVRRDDHRLRARQRRHAGAGASQV